jgi:predicted amidophosphoribosyltransferase
MNDDSPKPSLVPCPLCGGTVASDAYSCPHCGKPLRMKLIDIWARVQLGFFIFALAMMTIPLLFVALRGCN